MVESTLQLLLDSLIATWENEVVEFKQAKNNFDTDQIGEYFSALSNEANLRGVERSWLVVWRGQQIARCGRLQLSA
jgi:ATP-dependent DNA helicase RecG